MWVLPKDIANQPLTQNLTGDFDFGTTAIPNLYLNDGLSLGELPDQIDGYNYLAKDVIDVDYLLAEFKRGCAMIAASVDAY